MPAALVMSLAVMASAPAAQQPGERTKVLGFSDAGKAALSTQMNAAVKAGDAPAIVEIVVNRDGVLYEGASGLPTNAIFNIASMTKPMTTVGALMLYERGKILIDEPLAKYFPKFSTMRVAARDAAGEPTAETVPANRPITIQDLMRHTSGLIYGGRGNTLVHKLYPAGSSDAAREYDGAAFMDKLASLPLLYQPATVWDYGFGLDVLGLTIETVSRTLSHMESLATIEVPSSRRIVLRNRPP